MLKVLRRNDRTTLLWRGYGVTAWRRSGHRGYRAISFLARGGDGVPIQVVIGDWWLPTNQSYPSVEVHVHLDGRKIAAATDRRRDDEGDDASTQNPG